MRQTSEQLQERISEIRRNSESLIVEVNENKVHDLMGDIRFLLNAIDAYRTSKDAYKKSFEKYKALYEHSDKSYMELFKLSASLERQLNNFKDKEDGGK